MSWLILSILALFTFVAYDVASRYCAVKSANPRAFATIFNGLVMIIAPLVFLVDRTLPRITTWQAMLYSVIGLALWGLNGRFEYFAKKHTEISTFTIVTKIAPVGTFILATIFLHETLTMQKLAGIILMLVANYLLFAGHSWRKVISAEGLKYSLLISGIIAFAWFFDAINIKNWGVAAFSTLSFGISSLVSGLFPALKLKDLKRELRLTPIWQFLTLAILNLAGYAMQLKALSIGPASNIMPIITSTSPFVVLFGLLFLGERDFLARKFVAAAIAVGGIYLMR